VATSDFLRFDGLDGVAYSIILAGGSIEMTRGDDLVVVCAGDLVNTASGKGHWSKTFLRNSIVVARGSIRCSRKLANCVILAGGDVSFEERTFIGNSLIRAAGTVTLPRKSNIRNSDLKGGVSDALRQAPVKFFETSSLGMQVAPSKEGVRVTAATASKA